MSHPQSLLRERSRGTAIRRHFGDYERLSRLLCCIGCPVRGSVSDSVPSKGVEVTAATVVQHERIHVASRLLMRITSRPSPGRRRLIVIRGHPGGPGPLLAHPSVGVTSSYAG